MWLSWVPGPVAGRGAQGEGEEGAAECAWGEGAPLWRRPTGWMRGERRPGLGSWGPSSREHGRGSRRRVTSPPWGPAAMGAPCDKPRPSLPRGCALEETLGKARAREAERGWCQDAQHHRLETPVAGHPEGLWVTSGWLRVLRRASRQNLPFFPNWGKEINTEEYRIMQRIPGDMLPRVRKG